MLVSNPVLSKVSTVPAAVTLISKTSASKSDVPGISGDGDGGGGGGGGGGGEGGGGDGDGGLGGGGLGEGGGGDGDGGLGGGGLGEGGGGDGEGDGGGGDGDGGGGEGGGGDKGGDSLQTVASSPSRYFSSSLRSCTSSALDESVAICFSVVLLTLLPKPHANTVTPLPLTSAAASMAVFVAVLPSAAN